MLSIANKTNPMFSHKIGMNLRSPGQVSMTTIHIHPTLSHLDVRKGKQNYKNQLTYPFGYWLIPASSVG